MLKIKYILFLVVLFFYNYAHAVPGKECRWQPMGKSFIFDRYGSPYTGSSIFMSTRALLNELEDFLISEEKSQTTWVRIASSLINFYMSLQLSTFNHEIYGHGFRARSLGGSVNYYKFSFSGGGSTSSEFPYPNNTDDIILLLRIGGIEANQVLAKEIMLKHFKYRTIDIRTYSMFLCSFLDLWQYVRLTAASEEVRHSQGNDIISYLKGMNKYQEKEIIQLDDLENATSILLLNPFWTLCVYIFKNNPSLTIPYILYNNIAYMPLVRPGLTPFGIAYYLENYIGYEDKTALLSLYTGNSPFYTNAYGGVKLQIDNLWSYQDYCILDIEAGLWHQPMLQLSWLNMVEHKNYWDRNYWGGLIGIGSKFMLNSRFFMYTKLLYKTEGFVEGIVAKDGFILQLGCSLDYNN
jgi:hypothetical protein